jgi:hypothetical protein
VHLQDVLEITSTGVYTDLTLFNFIRKAFQQIFSADVYVCKHLLQFLTHSVCVGGHDTLQILLLPTDKCLVE